MGRRVSIPVRVIRPERYQATPTDTAGADREPHTRLPAQQQDAMTVKPRSPLVEKVEPETQALDEPCEGLEEWRERALRLQADMENYRKRQQRLAQDQIEQERNRLLNAFLGVVDDLERALATPAGDDSPRDAAGTAGDALGRGNALRRGVELTHHAAMQLLEKEGVTAISAAHRPFDPNWHEAVATVPRDGSDVAPDTVVQVIEPGYRLGEQLLRPAKVVVAV